MICWFAGQPTIFMYIHTSTGEKTVYWVVIRQIGGLFNQHNATNSKSFTGQLLYLLDYRAYTWQITAKSRTNVHLADNNNWKNKQKICDYFFVVKFTSWCIFCIYKISYQILFPLSMCSYVKSFFMKKVSKYHFLAERRDKLLIYNKIEEWYILDYLTRSIIEVSLIW